MSSFSNRYSQHSFAQTPSVNIPRSKFDRSFNIKDTLTFDYIYPIMVDEVLPGDTLSIKLNAFCRLATQLNPIMDNIYLDFFFFFVPNRLLWKNWEKFCGAQTNPGDSISYTIPTVSVTNLTVGDGLYEKMGLPLQAGTQVVNSLPFRAYNLIWNEWFRNENLTNSAPLHTDDGPDSMSDYTGLQRHLRPDYFTSALPWPQKGTALTIPMATASVITDGTVVKFRGTTENIDRNFSVVGTGGTPTAATYMNGFANVANESVKFGSNTGLSAIGGTINQLRQAWQLQTLLEKDARGGTRYVELLLMHFGVTSPDFRLQRPEYLGGGTININSHAVPQTSSTSGSSYRGDLSAFSVGTSSGKNIGFTHSFVEHGYILGLVSARADVTYQQGINKLWLRSTRYDFYWPSLQDIGEQTILEKEIYASSTGGHDNDVFGYQERYAEYRYKPSEIHGNFRSNSSTPLDSWHLGLKFTSYPSLNDAFVMASTPPIARTMANSAAQPILCDYFFEYHCARPMKMYSIPAGIGRF